MERFDHLTVNRTAIALLVVAALFLGACAHTPECRDCPVMVTIPAGVATLGTDESDELSNRDETPLRSVEISQPFAVSKFEITRGQYEAFVRATNHRVEGNCLTDRSSRGKWVYDANTTFRDPGFMQGDDHPVACVDYDDAKAYVAWLNGRTHGGYRLLSEVEWEYVARAGADPTSRYPWGSDAAAGCPFTNGFDQTTLAAYTDQDTSGYKLFDPLGCRDGWLNTSPVGSLAPNKFGVHDMIGNVSEWLEECYSASRDISAGTGPAGTGQVCARRITKGGSWGTLAHNLRIAERLPYAATHRDDSIGIRVARTLP